MKSSQRYATPPSPEALSAFTAPSSLSRPGGRLFLGRSNALEEEMVDVIAPVEPEPLLVRLERHPHLRRQTRVEEISMITRASEEVARPSASAIVSSFLAT